MKKIIIIGIIASLCSGVSYAGEIELPHITVFGTATKKVTPDVMFWELTVKNKAKTLHEVAESHTKHVEEVLTLLRRTRVPAKEMQTTRMEFGENWEYKNRSRVKEGYFASTNIAFKIRDFQKYKLLWIGLSKIGNVTVNRVYYDHSKRIDLQNETRKQALLLAKEKAVTLAEALGSQIGEPLLITEDQHSFTGLRSSNAIISDGNVNKGKGIALGKISIKMRIKIVFRLITYDK